MLSTSQQLIQITAESFVETHTFFSILSQYHFIVKINQIFFYSHYVEFCDESYLALIFIYCM